MNFCIFRVVQPSPQSTSEHFHDLKKNPLCPLAVNCQSSHSIRPKANPNLSSVSIHLLILNFNMNKVI